MAGVGNAATKGGPVAAGQVVQLWPLSRFRPYDRNPRKNDHAVERVAAAIREFGFKVPVLARSNGELIDGHLRLKAATFLGLESVPVLVADDLSDAQVRAFRISVNRMAELAEWDTELLASELDELAQLDVPAELAGWTGAELEEFDVPVAAPEVLADPEEVPEVKPVVTTRPGDLWLLGGHRLLCGDSTKAEDVTRVIAEGPVGAVLTDPPYGLGIDGQRLSIAANPKHNRKAHPFKGWDSTRPPPDLFSSLQALNVPTCIWGGNYFADLLPATRGWLFWSKGQDGLSMSDGELAWTSLQKPLRAITVNRGTLHGSTHPTQKPVPVMAFALAYLEPFDGMILDPFLGSGTTLIAAEQLGRKCYGLELDPGYCDVIVRRWEGVTGKQATLEATGETFAAVAAKRAEVAA